ncbi:Hypothetical protein R9X50_00278800 [Acrodontium crateriforme]|uniref:C2H2-type domain-containing protein n=1 Tax=Acrodontium crateriforme TaxID=150365 RepID=A0AAQ3M506_9PEZI|nr:Hypothetical protein R9X50_00278800 [Acrodontium crateriforme]
MAEVFGVACGALQVADAGIKLAETLYEYLDTVRNASKQLESVALQVKVTSSTLRSLGELLEDHEAEKVCSQHVVADAQLAFKGCEKTFLDVEDTFRALIRSDGPSIGKVTTAGRWVYPFKKGKLETLQANLERLKTTLLLMLSVLTYARESKNRTIDNVSKLEDQKRHIQTLMKDRQEATKRHDELLAAFSRFDTNDQSQPPPKYNIQAELDSTARDVGGMGTGTHMNSFMVTSTIPSVVAPLQFEPVQGQMEIDKQKIIEHLSNCAEAVARLSQEINKAASMFSFNKTTTFAPIDQSFRHVTEKVQLMLQETKHPGYPPNAPHVSARNTQTMVSGYQQQVEIVEQQSENLIPIPLSPPPRRLLDHQIQLMMLEEENKKRILAGRDEVEVNLSLEHRQQAQQQMQQRQKSRQQPQVAQVAHRQWGSSCTTEESTSEPPDKLETWQKQLTKLQHRNNIMFPQRADERSEMLSSLPTQHPKEYSAPVQAQAQQAAQQSAVSVLPPPPLPPLHRGSRDREDMSFARGTLGDDDSDFDFESFLPDNSSGKADETKGSYEEQDEEDMDKTKPEIQVDPKSPPYNPVSEPHSGRPPLPPTSQLGSNPPSVNMAISATQSPVGGHALDEYNTQLMLLEQENQRRVLLERQRQDMVKSAPQSQVNNPGRAEYRMQLMLLDQQNKRRLLMARQEQDRVKSAPQSQVNNPERAEYRMQLRLLDQQNKRRLLMARQEQDMSTSVDASEAHVTCPADSNMDIDIETRAAKEEKLVPSMRQSLRRGRAKSDMNSAAPTAPAGEMLSSTPSQHIAQNTLDKPAFSLLRSPSTAALTSPILPSIASPGSRDVFSRSTALIEPSSSKGRLVPIGPGILLGSASTQEEFATMPYTDAKVEHGTDELEEKKNAENGARDDEALNSRRRSRKAPANSPTFGRAMARSSQSNSSTRATDHPDSRAPNVHEAVANLSSAGEASRRVQKHPATFQCKLCDRKFTRAYNWASHLCTHTDSEKTRKKKRAHIDERKEGSAVEDDAGEEEPPMKRQDRASSSTETLATMDTDAPLLGAQVDDVDDLLRLWTTVGVE